MNQLRFEDAAWSIAGPVPAARDTELTVPDWLCAPQADMPVFDHQTAPGKLADGLSDEFVHDLLEEGSRKLPWDITSEGVLNVSYHNLQQRYQQKKNLILQKAYRECQRITSLYAKTFYLGTSFLSKGKRLPVWSIYVWCRRTDDIVGKYCTLPRAAVGMEDLPRVFRTQGQDSAWAARARGWVCPELHPMSVGRMN